ncbi:pilus assembly protein [Alisedimentitalea sp. MJ-SS2]|uniref:TadE/TadG family type IV pilus assembly protein n=1 Tax=Aliisedimentitalea sp. MJ-SS2 TaxID=3049795 RepID=UPI00290F802C|nr:pilus assembly protein [Alisedimentitalea sp. MJ-SS2]MDU8929985.1 pilus assembly protein [Alisedimentitalea sp. MJ-SS2]
MKTILNTLKSRFTTFARDDSRGSVSVEAALIFPVVMWALLAMFVFFEGYRQSGINHKAANTIADMYSRETMAITPLYVDNTKDLFDIMSEANSDTRVRISVIKWSKRKNRYEVDWSEVRGGSINTMSDSTVAMVSDKLPTLPPEERVILVETWSTFTPLFNIGMDPVEIRTFVFTRLRFAPQLPFCRSGNCEV